jgi:hypothetical protein
MDKTNYGAWEYIYSWALVAHAYNPSNSGGRIKRIIVQSQPREIVGETLSRKHPTKKRAGKVAQGVDPELRPHHCKINK